MREAYLEKARYAYDRWGAAAKVWELEKRFGDLLSARTTIFTAGSARATAQLDTTTTEVLKGIDLATFMKAAQAISGEIVLENLLRRLMLVILRGAGAQKGSLIICAENGLVVEVEGESSEERVRSMKSEPIERSNELSPAIVHFVARTRESVVLDEPANEGRFINDAYVLSRKPKSILCAPLVYKGRLSGIVYLENNLTAGAFTPDSLEVVKLLCAHAAIAMENARLYEQLELRVAQRTKDLEEARDLAEKANRAEKRIPGRHEP